MVIAYSDGTAYESYAHVIAGIPIESKKSDA